MFSPIIKNAFFGAVLGHCFMSFVEWDLLWFAPPATSDQRFFGLFFISIFVGIAAFIGVEKQLDWEDARRERRRARDGGGDVGREG